MPPKFVFFARRSRVEKNEGGVESTHGGLSATSESVLGFLFKAARVCSSRRNPHCIRSHPPYRPATLITESATSGAGADN